MTANKPSDAVHEVMKRRIKELERDGYNEDFLRCFRNAIRALADFDRYAHANKVQAEEIQEMRERLAIEQRKYESRVEQHEECVARLAEAEYAKAGLEGAVRIVDARVNKALNILDLIDTDGDDHYYSNADHARMILRGIVTMGDQKPDRINPTGEMFANAIRALAEIDRELGMPEDGCNSTQATLAAIRLLHSAHRDDVANNQRLTALLIETVSRIEGYKRAGWLTSGAAIQEANDLIGRIKEQL